MARFARISPCLWFDGKAVEAAEFYVSLFEDSRIDHVLHGPTDWPGGKAGEPLFVAFTLAGQAMQALNGGPYTEFTNAVSLSVACADQAEVDRLWAALTADGGEEVQCGWLRDRFGLSWQIVPEVFFDMLRANDPDRAARFMAEVVKMVKLDVAVLERAYRGDTG